MPEIINGEFVYSEAERIEMDIDLDERYQREVASGFLSAEMVMRGYPVPEGWTVGGPLRDGFAPS